MTLADLPLRSSAHITGYSDQGAGFYQLHQLGVIPGAKVSHLHTAPLGDPLQIQVDNTRISIRKRDARHILIKPLQNSL